MARFRQELLSIFRGPYHNEPNLDLRSHRLSSLFFNLKLNQSASRVIVATAIILRGRIYVCCSRFLKV